MGLTGAQMARMSRLLDEALPLDASGRREWLDELPPEQADLAQALREALLPEANSWPSFTFAADSTLGSDEGSFASEIGLESGSRIGPYELIRALGAGGMAEVWLARRADGAFRREVALKLPMFTRFRKDLAHRFAQERDILAGLEHPNIARLYDAGSDASGLPYLSMEYVPGCPITEWCDAHSMGIRARLELFRQVLDAVHYAHDRQVIHRDLKPSNILVTETGQVRLLDFGIAKLLEASAGDAKLTQLYGRALTPDYASPEMLRGDAIDGRSDIYSLGVLLYELMTGTRPYHLNAASVESLPQAISNVEIEPPSAHLADSAGPTHATTAERLARQLRGDLSAILLKALAMDSAQRYASAAALREDIERYLAGRPVAARPSRFLYRFKKFTRRHRSQLALGAAAAAVLLATVGYSLYREATLKEIAARSLRASSLSGTQPPAAPRPALAPPLHSIAVLPFVDMSEKHDQEYFSQGLAEELLDHLAQVPGLHVTARTSSFYFKDKQVPLADISKSLNVANILEGGVRKSGNHIRVTTQLIRADSGEQLWSHTYDRELKDVFRVQDDIASAVVGALKLTLVHGYEIPSAYGTSNADAYNAFLLGRQFYEQSSIDGWHRAADEYHKAVALDPSYAPAWAALAMTEVNLLDWEGDPTALERAKDAADRAIAVGPDRADGYGARAYLRWNYAWDWTGAQTDFQRALSINPSDSSLEQRYAYFLFDLGRLPESIAANKNSIAIDPLYAYAWQLLGYALTASRDFAGAHQAIRRALEIQPTDSYSLSALGTLQLLEGNASDALNTFERITELTGIRLYGIALAEHSLGHAQQSHKALEELIATQAQTETYQIAVAYAWCGEKDKAFEWFERAYRQHDSGLVDIKSDPLLGSLRADARYKALLRRINLKD
jgi:serine/threonine protein kinase